MVLRTLTESERETNLEQTSKGRIGLVQEEAGSGSDSGEYYIKMVNDAFRVQRNLNGIP